MKSKRNIKVKTTERGWGGHFICADRCYFRRNTLIEAGKKKIVVSTIGVMRIERNGQTAVEPIGANGRYYETMAFHAKKNGPYLDANISEQITFESKWSICADSVKRLPEDSDNLANEMHENVVKELSKKIRGIF